MATDFVFEFFCRPILEQTGYNLVNTLVYVVILLAIAFGLVWPWLKKTQIPLDHRFLVALLPFIVLGSSLRILEDLQLVSATCNPVSVGFYAITPGIYILVGVLAILSVWLANRFAKNHFFVALGGIGILLAFGPLLFVLSKIIVWDGLVGVVVLALVLTGIGVFGSRFFKKTKALFSNRFNQLVFLGQMLDASATFVSLQFYNCSEQHVLSAGIIDLFGPFSFVIVKFVLMLLVLYFADKEIDDPKTNWFVKLLIGIIGFAPGLRDVLTLGVGTCL